jgi:hypothetical protein
MLPEGQVVGRQVLLQLQGPLFALEDLHSEFGGGDASANQAQ